VAPESEQSVVITEWLYDPRGLDRYVSVGDVTKPYAVARHAEYPGVQAHLEYDQELNLRGAKLESLENGPNLTARFLRSFPFGAVDKAARAHMAWWWREYDKGRSEAARTAYPIPSNSMEAIDIRRPGRRGRPDLEYAELALDYVKWLDTPDSGSLDKFAKTKFLSASQIRNLLYEARRRGLLTEAPAGRSGGMLTNKALALLGAKTHTAPRWTPEQIEAAHKRDEPFRELAEQLRTDRITGTEYGERLDQLVKETFGDPGDSIQVNRGKD
jgi:hypothetical protein